MKRIALVLSVLCLAACASTAHSHNPMPPVNVVVTADQPVKYYVQADTLTRATEAALRKYASDAAPLTLSVRFTSLAAVADFNTRVDVRAYPDETGPRSAGFYPIISTQPWNEGVRQRETTASKMPVPLPLGARQAVKGVYTITDAEGRVLDRNDVFAGVNDHDGPAERLPAEQRSTAEFLAKRVAKLTKKQQG